MHQTTDKVIMIRPKHFGSNPETAASNTFQSTKYDTDEEQVSESATAEFDALVSILRENGVEVKVIEDTEEPPKADAVFPNNWLSTHGDGAIVTYPMFSTQRRSERREDIIEELRKEYPIGRRYAFEQYEEQDQYLEGTGSMVLDRVNRIVYACISDRTNVMVLNKWCVLRGFEKVTFHAYSKGVAIYHTNVVMALGEEFVVVCLKCIPSEGERAELVESFSKTGKEIIEISTDQMNSFAGNMLQLSTRNGGKILVMSTTARTSLSSTQIKTLEKYNTIVTGDIPTIEKYGGGSVRCMIAENFLD